MFLTNLKQILASDDYFLYYRINKLQLIKSWSLNHENKGKDNS